MITHNVVTTKTGLRVIQVPISGIKSVTVLALVNTGSRYEQPKWWGIAHFLEHMVFKGTEKYPDTQVLASTVDAVGAKWNAFTSKEYTGYYVKAASSQASLAIDVISELLLTPQIRQEDIDREKGVIVEEMNMYADMPAAHIANLYEQMIFDEKTLGHDIIGVRDTVNNLTATDFNEFIHQWYGLKNVVLILSGDPEVVGNAKTMTEIEKAFAKGNPGKRQAAVALEHLGDHPMTDKRFLLEYRKTEQAHFVLGFPSLSRKHPDRYAASLLSVVIGGSMSSRLFSEVREKRGLCYYIHSDLDFFHDTGMFGASAGVDPQRVEEALKVTIDQFASVVDGRQPITQADLKKAKDFMAGKFILDLEDSENVAQYYGMKQLLIGEIESPDEVLAKYQAVTLEDMNRVAKDIIQMNQIRFAIIGPFEDPQKFQQLLPSTSTTKAEEK